MSTVNFKAEELQTRGLPVVSFTFSVGWKRKWEKIKTKYCNHCNKENCGLLPSSGGKCSNCKQVWYCNIFCEINGWRSHRHKCHQLTRHCTPAVPHDYEWENFFSC